MSDTTAAEPIAEVQCDTKATDEAKRKKKKTKSLDVVLRELPPTASDEEKIQFLCQKCHTLLQEQRESSAKLKQYENAVQSIRTERDQLQGDRNRLMLQKDKLETLCRELQKQNKVVQEESLARCRAEEEKRRTISDHFQSSITSIQTQLNEYQNRNQDLRKENQDLADKLEQFIKQHKEREQHVEKIIHARELEAKLSEAKLHKAQCMLDQERIKSQQMVAQMKQESKLMQDRVDAHMEVETKLKEQIEFYKTKYQSFNKTIAQSNKMFDTAKEEMEKLVKRIKQSEHDVVEWRGKWELSQRSLFEVVAEHKKQSDELAAAKKQTERLANLCRALRAQLNQSEEAKTDRELSVEPSGDAADSTVEENQLEKDMANLKTEDEPVEGHPSEQESTEPQEQPPEPQD